MPPVTDHTETNIRAGRRAWVPHCPVLPPVRMGVAPGTPGRGNGGNGGTGRYVWLGMQEANGMLLPGPAQPSLPWPHARASSCPLKPCCPWCSWLLPSYSTWFLFCLPFQVYLVLALPVCPSQFTLALGTTHSFSWVQPKHFPLHWACIAPHPLSFQGETNPSSSAGHSSPANCLRPVPGAILSPTAPAFVCMSAQPLLCPTPLLHGALAGCQAGLLTHNLPSSAEGTKHQGRGHGGCAGATLPCTSYLQ